MTEKHDYRGKNSSCRGHTATKKVFLMLVIAGFMLLLLPMISSMDWDNVAKYDEETQTITTKNSILGIPFLSLDTIANIRLDSELEKEMSSSYDNYFEIEVNSLDKRNIITGIKYYKYDKDTKEIGEEIQKENYWMRYDENADRELITYNKVCGKPTGYYAGLPIINCEYEEIKTIEKGDWVPYNINEEIEGEFLLRNYIEIKEFEWIEYVPEFVGVKVDEWASVGNDGYTVLLLNMDGTDGSTEFLDTSVGGSTHKVLAVADAQVDTSVKKFGTGSVLLDGTGDYLTISTSSDWDFGAGNWTIDFWAYKLDATTGGFFALGEGDATFVSYLPADTNMHLYLSKTGAGWDIFGGDVGVTINEDTWTHVAIVRNGTSITTFINGFISTVMINAGTDALWSPVGNFSIGTNDVVSREYTNVQLDEFRVSNVARWIGDFTPPTEAYGFGEVPTVTLNSPENASTSTSRSITFNATAYTTTNNNIVNVSLYLDGVINETNSSGFNDTHYYFTKTFDDGDYNWTVESYSNSSQSTTAPTRTFSVDTNYPELKVIYPIDTITFHKINTNLSLNWSANDTHLDSCWYDWNTTNITVTCSDNQTNINITDGTNKELTFYANDTSGLLSSSTITWNYQLFLDKETYSVEVFESLSSTFSATFIINGSDITSAILRQNNTNNVGTISNHGSNNFTVTKTITAPKVSANTNKSFYWNIIQGTLNYNLTGKNQTILNLGIDNCSTNTDVLYNFTIKNEENLAELTNTIVNLNIQIYGFATTNLIQSYNKTYTSENPFAVCLNNNLSNGGEFSHDAQIQYEVTGYVQELYHIQNETVNSSSFLHEINLYPLNSSDSQIFKIIFRDSSFLPVENALVKIYRKYVDENLYRIVEIPKTDKKGETLAHLVLNEVVYKIEVVKYGVILETFTDVLAVCQTPLVASCEIDLNAFSESITIPDYEEAEDFSFTLGYDNDTRIISSAFTIPSGTVQTILLNVTTTDSLGAEVCTDTLVSNAGILSCLVPSTFGNSTIIAKLYKSGNLQAQGNVKLDQTPSQIYGVNLVFLALFVMITLIGAGLSDDPRYTVIFLLVGVALLFALNLVANDGFIGATATFLFLVIAVVLVIIKGGRK